MPVIELNHYFVRANDLERSRRFYCDVLGFEVMPRPYFPFPGHWLGVGGKVQVHLGLHGVPDSDRHYLGSTASSATDHAGIVDHVAFLATDPQAFAQRFEAIGLPARHRYLPDFQIFQMFVTDPDGLTLELNFHGIGGRPSWSAGVENGADRPGACNP